MSDDQHMPAEADAQSVPLPRLAANADLAATGLVPSAEIAPSELRRARLELEFRPDTESGRFMVNHLSDSIDGIALAQKAEEALVAALPAMVESCFLAADANNDGLRLAAVYGGPVMERIAKYRAAREKQALALLKELTNPGRGRAFQTVEAMDEAWCLAWLMRRFSAASWRCPRCAHPRGDCLRVRAVWHCRRCGKQVGVRVGTVMVGSSVPLGVWFAITKVLIERPETSGRQLAKFFELRPQTVYGMRRRIVAALDRPDQRHRLAGLDQLFGGHLLQASHPTALPALGTPGISAESTDSPIGRAGLPAPGVSPGDSD